MKKWHTPQYRVLMLSDKNVRTNNAVLKGRKFYFKPKTNAFSTYCINKT